MKLMLIFAAAACALVLAGCALQRVIPTHTTVIQHGPFEIVATGRRVSSGGFPNTSANPFATMEVTEFSVRWRGQAVQVPEAGQRFWHAFRLPDAQEPALLVSTTDVHLLSEHDGRLVIQRLGPKTTDLVQLQWLDSQDGQPGGSNSYGIVHVDPASGTELRGGRWLRVGQHTVLDVQRLKIHELRPWVPEGQPLAGMNGGSTAARMFSPGRTQFVVPASQYDHATDRRIEALTVVDIPSGDTYALQIDPSRMRFADHDDIHLTWVDHYFEWTRDTLGRDRLARRRGAKAMPWRGRYVDFRDFIEYRVQPVRAEMQAALTRFVAERLGARALGGGQFEMPGCDHVIAVSFHDDRTSVYSPIAKAPPWYRCQDSVRRIGAAFDAELASGRLDPLFLN